MAMFQLMSKITQVMSMLTALKSGLILPSTHTMTPVAAVDTVKIIWEMDVTVAIQIAQMVIAIHLKALTLVRSSSVSLSEIRLRGSLRVLFGSLPTIPFGYQDRSLMCSSTPLQLFQIRHHTASGGSFRLTGADAIFAFKIFQMVSRLRFTKTIPGSLNTLGKSRMSMAIHPR